VSGEAESIVADHGDGQPRFGHGPCSETRKFWQPVFGQERFTEVEGPGLSGAVRPRVRGLHPDLDDGCRPAAARSTASIPGVVVCRDVEHVVARLAELDRGRSLAAVGPSPRNAPPQGGILTEPASDSRPDRRSGVARQVSLQVWPCNTNILRVVQVALRVAQVALRVAQVAVPQAMRLVTLGQMCTKHFPH